MRRSAALGEDLVAAVEHATGVDTALDRGLDRLVVELARVLRADHPAGAVAEEAGADVVRDAEGPGQEARAALEGGQRAVELDEGLLGQVLGLRRVADALEREGVHPREIGAVDLRESGLVARDDAVDELTIALTIALGGLGLDLGGSLGLHGTHSCWSRRLAPPARASFCECIPRVVGITLPNCEEVHTSTSFSSVSCD